MVYASAETKLIRPLASSFRARIKLTFGTRSFSNVDHCAKLVREGDYDGLLYSTLQGRDNREAALVVRAFNVEMASIKDTVRGNEKAGKIRMQWWKDALGDIFAGDPPHHPVALALAEILKESNITGSGLTRRWFDRIIDTRLADISVLQPDSIAHMESYAENTASSLLYIMMEIAGIRPSTVPGAAEIGHSASHVGKAVGICTALRTVPLLRQTAKSDTDIKRESAIPRDLTDQYGIGTWISQRPPESGEEAFALEECVFKVATKAKEHMDAAAEGLRAARDKCGGALPKGSFETLLPAVRAAWYLETLEKCNFNAYDERLRPRSPFRFQLRLARAIFKKSFTFEEPGSKMTPPSPKNAP